ncbi:hypothetical protein PAAG_01231 [Paracoccidioides lutzii Pb01]|uniref:Uncharacterized protein n=1 Tax=Paracoccidioides lutzii (strain ATCC MYA-826 / Pb01) TaxID=502779 RepID=C1GRT6_PARBA|nr:hypothetical protein PAAG_01231 [Paracoccidioides lutzii Pb01]EEH38310.2 hypothetical protein PAAG_01231 [Paracoccidioides lutzii Pb01]
MARHHEERVKKAKKYARMEKVRKFFCRGSKPPGEPLEDEQPVIGQVILVRMHRVGLSRKVEFEAEELTRLSDRAVIAMFEKRRSAHYHGSIKTGQPPNKKKLFIGTLRVNDRAYGRPAGTNTEFNGFSLTAFTCKIDALTSDPRRSSKDLRDLDPYGSHVGNLTEDRIMLSCWIVIEAEHRLQYKILDLLEEVAENSKGWKLGNGCTATRVDPISVINMFVHTGSMLQL